MEPLHLFHVYLYLSINTKSIIIKNLFEQTQHNERDVCFRVSVCYLRKFVCGFIFEVFVIVPSKLRERFTGVPLYPHTTHMITFHYYTSTMCAAVY